MLLIGVGQQTPLEQVTYGVNTSAIALILLVPFPGSCNKATLCQSFESSTNWW
ncbi:MAG: hypothetical protein V7L20_22580 [Nostoc sp.]